MAVGWRTATFAVSLAAFAAVAAYQLWGLLRGLSRRPVGPERRAILEELLWVLTAVGAVLALTVQALRATGG